MTLEQFENIDFKHKQASENSQNIIDYLNAKGIDYDTYDERRRQYNREHPRSHEREIMDVRPDSIKRAKDSIFDYILNNEFDWFFTGTVNPEQLDSFSPKDMLKPIQKWLKNMVQRNDLHYIMIAEYHPSSGRIHFHGLCKGENLYFVDSGTKLYTGYNKPVSNEKAEMLGLTDGRTVYNMTNWKFGWSTAIRLTGDKMKTAFYVTKYITKDTKKIFGKFFWHSRSLVRPQIEIKDIDYDTLRVAESNGFKYVFTGGTNETD